MPLKSPPIALKVFITEEQVQQLAIAYTKFDPKDRDGEPLHLAAAKLLFAYNALRADTRGMERVISSSVDRKRSHKNKSSTKQS